MLFNIFVCLLIMNSFSIHGHLENYLQERMDLKVLNKSINIVNNEFHVIVKSKSDCGSNERNNFIIFETQHHVFILYGNELYIVKINTKSITLKYIDIIGNGNSALDMNVSKYCLVIYVLRVVYATSSPQYVHFNITSQRP